MRSFFSSNCLKKKQKKNDVVAVLVIDYCVFLSHTIIYITFVHYKHSFINSSIIYSITYLKTISSAF